MGLRALVAVASALAAGILIATTALADLRSPEGTAELGATLADDPAVRSLVSTTIVDALLDDATATSPEVAVLLPLVRPVLAGAVEAALASPAGRAGLAATLTDAARQLTFGGPIVLDLRDAVLAAADAAPEPLATLARTAVARGAVGIVVLGDTAGDPALESPEPPDAVTLARVGGLDASTATVLAWALLGLVLIAVTVTGGAGRRTRMRTAGGALVLVGAPATVLVRLAPEQVVDRVAGRLGDAGGTADAGGELLVAVLPALADGVAGLLARTGTVALLVAVAGGAMVLLSAAGSRRAADRRPRT